MTAFSWLFGLEGGHDCHISLPGLTIRKMTEAERTHICNRSSDFWARDERIWRNTTERFPYLSVKEGPATMPIGGEEIVGVIISLLSLGEVRTPIQWTSTGGGSSSSDIAALFYRLINSFFQPVRIETLIETLPIAAEKFGTKIHSAAHEIFGQVLLDRFIAAKAHPLEAINPGSANPIFRDAFVIARAADVAMMLEYLYHEGAKSEVLFRLGLSIAWVLGNDPGERAKINSDIKKTYDLRSMRVHGVASQKSLKATDVKAVESADNLLRRSILAKIVGNFDDEQWRELFSGLRLGSVVDEFDRANWLAI